MPLRITPNLIELTREALLASFWRKKSLVNFLRQHGIHASLNSDKESKRDLVDRLFPDLHKSDQGKKNIFEIVKSLREKTIFPDLKNWEDSAFKEEKAKQAISDLRNYCEKQEKDIMSEKEIKENKKKSREIAQKIRKKQTNINNLKDELDSLIKSIGTQEAGYKFEEWFHKLLDFCEIEHKKPYKSNYRQMDGSLTHQGTTYLLELKFTEKQIGTEPIDSIKAKVDKMADNTMGIVVSMSGYTEGAKATASGPKTTLLLLDFGHIYSFLTGSITKFSDIIERIRRHASQTGESYLDINKFGD